MMLDAVINKLNAFLPFIQKETIKLVIEQEPLIKILNITRLYDEGLDVEGRKIGTYKPTTVAARKAAGKPVPADLHWMSFWAGEFFQGIDLREESLEKVELTSTYAGFKHMEAYNKGYLGLTQAQADEIAQIVAEKLVDSIANYFK